MLCIVQVEDVCYIRGHVHWNLSNPDTLGTEVSLLVRCPDFRGCNVHKQGVWDSQRCPEYRGVLISGVS